MVRKMYVITREKNTPRLHKLEAKEYLEFIFFVFEQFCYYIK